MVKFADISEYYVGELAAKEEQDWVKTQQYKKYLQATQKVISDFGVTKILEIGCGSGFIPSELPETVAYVGVDKNPTFLEWARQKNQPSRKFIQEDIRVLDQEWLLAQNFEPDLVISFAFLKHFGFDEWNDITTRILSLAPMAIIEMQVGIDNLDNGTLFHHVFVTQEHLDIVIEAANHTTLYEDTILEENHFTSKMVITRRQ